VDLVFADRVWDRARVEGLVFGVSVEDSRSGDGFADVPGVGWFQLRCRAYDRGDVDAVCDAVQLEEAVSLIPDGRVRAAVLLAMHGWDTADIGSVLGGRGRSRTGAQLVEDGLDLIVELEKRRAAIRRGRK
jgi:hypothetical protein